MTATDLTVVVPHTGELLELSTTRLATIAELVLDIRDLESRLREVKAQLAGEVARRGDLERCWTMRDGPFKVSVPSDALVSEWQVEDLMEVLDGMVAAGEITTEAVQRTIEPTVRYRVIPTGVAALLKSPALAPRIEACRRLVEPSDRRLSVSRAT